MRLKLSMMRTVLFGAAMVAATVASAQAGASARANVLVSGPAGEVTLADLELIVKERVPAARRAEFWSNPAAIAQMARGLYAQRSLAQEATKAGLDRTAEGAAYLQLTRERALTELEMQARVRAKTPDAKAQEAYARGEYKAQPKRFELPDQIHARHILLAVAKDGSNDAAMKARAEDLIAQLRQGADFAKLAREQSADKGSAQRGGDLGVFGRGKMVPPFEKAAFALQKPGEISGPVRSDFGYHIIELVERQSARRQPFEEVLPALREEMLGKINGEERMRAWNAAEAAGKVNDDAVGNLAKSRAR